MESACWKPGINPVVLGNQLATREYKFPDIDLGCANYPTQWHFVVRGVALTLTRRSVDAHRVILGLRIGLKRLTAAPPPKADYPHIFVGHQNMFIAKTRLRNSKK